MRARGFLLILFLAGLFLFGAIVLGAPNWLDFGELWSGAVTRKSVNAGSVILGWLILAFVGGVMAFGVAPRKDRRRKPSRLSREAKLIFLAGIVILGIGLVHHVYSANTNFCCGSITEAQGQVDGSGK